MSIFPSFTEFSNIIDDGRRLEQKKNLNTFLKVILYPFALIVITLLYITLFCLAKSIENSPQDEMHPDIIKITSDVIKNKTRIEYFGKDPNKVEISIVDFYINASPYAITINDYNGLLNDYVAGTNVTIVRKRLHSFN